MARRAAVTFCGGAWLLFIPVLFAAEWVERVIAGGLGEPSRRVFRNAAVEPRLECADKRFLDEVLRELKAVGAEACGERGDDA